MMMGAFDFLGLGGSTATPSWFGVPTTVKPNLALAQAASCASIAKLPAAQDVVSLGPSPAHIVAATQPPVPNLSAKQQQWLATHPQWAAPLQQGLAAMNEGKPESTPQRMAMFLSLYEGLNTEGQSNLRRLLQQGVLNNTAGDDAHSTLYHLYAMATTPRLQGFNAKLLVQDALSLLAHPNDVEQDNVALGEGEQQAMLRTLQTPQPTNEHRQQVLPGVRTAASVNVVHTNNCAMAAQLSRMASTQPKELARHLNELTATGLFFKTVYPQDVLPENPAKAEEQLRTNNLRYYKVPKEGSFVVAIPAPAAGVQRALAAHNKVAKGQALGQKEASALMVLYENTLLYNAVKKGYDVAADKRDTLDLAQVSIMGSASLKDEQKQALYGLFASSPRPDVIRAKVTQALDALPNLSKTDRAAILNNLYGENEGLTASEKNLMERLLETGAGYTNVQYQVMGPPPNANHSNENDQYLYGYTHSFEAIEKDLVSALNTGRHVLLAQSFTSEGGISATGHEVPVKGYGRNPKTGELEFYIADTDDDKKGLITMSAKELIPKIHHMALPYGIAAKSWEPVLAHPEQFFVPDAADAKRYKLIPTLKATPPPTLVLPGVEKAQELARLKELSAAAAVATTPPPPTLNVSG